MNGSDLSKITSGLDEVSIKKQFNAQQQTFPCWLKASFESSLHRNGPSYPLSDCHVFRENCLRNNPHHPLSITQMSKYIYHNQRFSTSQDNSHSKTCDSLVNKKPIPSSPYSRPLSAKDFGLYMSESNSSLSSARTYPTKSHPNPSKMAASSSFPTNVNFFLKPQSLTLKNPSASNDVPEKYPLSKCNKSEVNCSSSKELQQITSSSFSKQSAFLSTISTSSVQILTSVNKHISSIPKPGCGFTKIPDISLNVRNLSYSPAVSYVESRQLLANDNHSIQSENSFLQKKKIYTFGQTVYYNIAYKPEKCLPGAKPFTTSANNVNCAPREECLLTERNLRAHQKDICIQTSETNCLQAANDAASESSGSLRKGLLGDGDTTTINSEGESDDSLTEESVSDYEEYEVSSCSLLSKQLLSSDSHPSQEKMYSSSPAPAITLCSALTPSLFPNVPPTINFVYSGCKVESLSLEMNRLLRWRLSPITPLVVKSALVRARFKLTNKHYDWIGCFGKHMKSQAFRVLRDFQKLNHFPGSFQIGRKDKLWRNLSKLQSHFGKKEYGFFPQTFILPTDLKVFKKNWDDGGNRVKWIIKPPASARGKGIRVIYKWSQIPKRRPIIVQRYLSRPFLINSSKFDIRLYILVSSFDPLRIYLYDDGLVRFASCKYTTATSSLNNRCIHLTNYSINKMNPSYLNNMGDNFQGHKWSLKALWSYLKKQGINSQPIWESIKDIIIKTIVSGEAVVCSMTRANLKSPYSVYELFGFDIILDEYLKPWLLEVNISPSLHSNTPLDVSIKEPMVCDVLNIAGFHLPAKDDLVTNVVNNHSENGQYKPPNKLCLDKRLYSTCISTDEKAKHSYYSQHRLDQQIQETILDILTPYDIRTLILTLDEEKRCGNFERIFPTSSTTKYLRFFEQPRYSNLLLDQWFSQFPKTNTQGLSLLKSQCETNVHLQNPTLDSKHQWVLPQSVCNFYAAKTPSPISKTQQKKAVEKTVEKTEKTR
ncbi:tubulin monoglutamylase TTLL4 [Octopus bimaculoides]|uniref:Tubulin polyglutamylase TTLL4 n=1 Tax=Octopus bimaculoides TaxID=37653 RepID=A0A0L8H9G0_OCTBM|nr:tubulin monoglutamylase TTLL4 [Octopus bimaculoides]XP_014774665.1 tubulin monoglutamylase TTLL4 [Octopus bimaculoides]|eukprot:XP_014774664.1 PREDICTED: tubulin polyglutamylase TTLL4-like [Octopus bimaculoides]